MKKLKYFIILFFGLPFVMDLLLSIPALHGVGVMLVYAVVGITIIGIFAIALYWIGHSNYVPPVGYTKMDLDKARDEGFRSGQNYHR